MEFIMPEKNEDTGLFDKKYRVATGSVGGLYHGETIEGEQLKELFISEANLKSRIALGALVEVPEENEDGTLAHTDPQPKAPKRDTDPLAQTSSAGPTGTAVAPVGELTSEERDEVVKQANAKQGANAQSAGGVGTVVRSNGPDVPGDVPAHAAKSSSPESAPAADKHK